MPKFPVPFGTRKYITYTTPEGYKCRDNKLFDEKYLKGEMENRFRRIKEEQQIGTRKSSNTISSKDELLFNRTRNTTGLIQMEFANNGRYTADEKEFSRFTRKIDTRQFKDKKGIKDVNRTEFKREFLQSEARNELCKERTEIKNIQNKNENGISNILGGIIAISNMFSNSQVNYKPRKIRGYKSLSKQAKKEYAKKKANASSFDWEEEI